MKTRFIRISDISDIDPSTVGVYDLNNRYIDTQGNMYGLRYNKQVKRIEVIKIIRTPAKTAPYFQQKLQAQKQLKSREGSPDLHEEVMPGMDDEAEALEEVVEMEFDPVHSINGILELMRIHKDRLNGIMMNIKNSRIIPETDRMDTNTLNSHFRNIDIDGIRRIEKVLDNQKELASYPRSLAYYQSKLDAAGRNIFELLGDDGRRMKFIYYSEMNSSIKHLYTALYRALKDLDFFLSEKNAETNKGLTFSEKQSFQDAIISIGNTVREISSIMKALKKLEEYINDPGNF